jgi:hypothetical protein
MTRGSHRTPQSTGSTPSAAADSRNVRCGSRYDLDVRTARVEPFNNGVAVNVADGPVTAATDLLRWTSLEQFVINLLIIGLVALIVAVALVPVEAAQHRFGRPS